MGVPYPAYDGTAGPVGLDPAAGLRVEDTLSTLGRSVPVLALLALLVGVVVTRRPRRAGRRSDDDVEPRNEPAVSNDATR